MSKRKIFQANKLWSSLPHPALSEITNFFEKPTEALNFMKTCKNFHEFLFSPTTISCLNVQFILKRQRYKKSQGKIEISSPFVRKLKVEGVSENFTDTLQTYLPNIRDISLEGDIYSAGARPITIDQCNKILSLLSGTMEGLTLKNVAFTPSILSKRFPNLKRLSLIGGPKKEIKGIRGRDLLGFKKLESLTAKYLDVDASAITSALSGGYVTNLTLCKLPYVDLKDLRKCVHVKKLEYLFLERIDRRKGKLRSFFSACENLRSLKLSDITSPRSHDTYGFANRRKKDAEVNNDQLLSNVNWKKLTELSIDPSSNCDLSHLKALESLRMFDCRVPTKLLDGLPNLRKLVLLLTKLSRKQFEQLGDLEELTISFQKSSIRNDFFLPLKNLKVFENRSGENDLKNLTPKIINNFPKLRKFRTRNYHSALVNQELFKIIGRKRNCMIDFNCNCGEWFESAHQMRNIVKVMCPGYDTRKGHKPCKKNSICFYLCRECEKRCDKSRIMCSQCNRWKNCF